MHVLLIPSWYPTTERPQNGLYFVDQAKALSRRGLRVGVLYPELQSLRHLSPQKFRRKHFQRAFSIEHGILTLRQYGWNFLWRSSLRFLLRIWMAERLIRQYVTHAGCPDIIHAHSARWAAAAAVRIGRSINRPYVLTEHFTGFERNILSKLEQRLAHEGFNQADAIITVSTHLRQVLDQNGFVSADRVRVIPNMVDDGLFTLPPKTRSSASFQFFALGHLHPWKGYDLLLNAFARAFPATASVCLVIGGDGAEAKNLKQQTQRLGLSDRVTFRGSMTRTAIRDTMWQSHAFVHPSFQETFGVVLIEAMATGLPVLATACGGPEDIVTPTSGTLVPSQNEDALAREMRVMVEKQHSYNPTQIRQYAVQRFGADAIAAQLESLYRSVLSATS